MLSIWAENALTSAGWQRHTQVDVDRRGKISAVTAGAAPGALRVPVLIPAPANLHSHAFQRAVAGLGEKRGPDASDSFWSWRTMMYRFLPALNPDDVAAISAYVQMLMLETGFAAVGEFHYLHHQPNGDRYQDIAAMSQAVADGAATSGIGMTLLPVLYQQGGCDGRAVNTAQRRFVCTNDQFGLLWSRAKESLRALPDDARIGIAPHSLRAVSRSGLQFATTLSAGDPLHIHIAEQIAEVDEVESAYGARPVAWLLDNADVSERWCCVHATHMTADETHALADSGAVAGLCPITESNLGDGIFNAVRFMQRGGTFGVGSDSNVRIDLTEELRTLEYSQRLRDHGRALLASADQTTGRALFEGACTGGAMALGRASGSIAPGKEADLIALNDAAVDLLGTHGDDFLDVWIFTNPSAMIQEVWSAGRHLVTGGRHRHRDRIESRYRQTLSRLRGAL